MQTALYQSLKFFNCLIPFLIVFGGFVFPVGGAKIEVGMVDPWAFLLLILNFAYSKTFKEKSPLEKAINFILEYDFKKKHYFILLMTGFGYLFLAHTAKYLSFNVHGLDQAYLHQAMLNAFETPFLRCDVCNFGSYMGEHTSPILALVAPLYILTKSNILIYLLEVLLVGFGTHFLIKTFYKGKVNHLVLLLFIILCHRGIRYSLIWDFREDHLTFFFLSFTFISLFKHRYVWSLLLFCLALITKEHLVYFLPFLVIPIWLEPEFNLSRRQKVVCSLFVVALPIIWMFALKNWLVPMYNGGNPPTNHIVGRFPGYGETNSEVVKNILFNPKSWVRLFKDRVMAGDTWKYLYMLFGPFIIIIYRRWWWLAAAAPLIAMNVLSYTNTQRSLSFHYELSIYSLLILAVILGFNQISRKRLYFALILAVLTSGRWPGFYLWKNFPSVENLKDQRFFANVEKNLLFAASFKNTAYLNHLKKLKVFRCSQDTAHKFEVETEHIAPGFNLKGAQAVILDKSEDCEKKLLNSLKNSDWIVFGTSSSGKYVKLKRNKDLL